MKTQLMTVGAAALLLGVFFPSCTGSSSGGPAVRDGDADLIRIVAGRIVDVYGYRIETSGAKVVSLFESDVVIGPDIVDERDLEHSGFKVEKVRIASEWIAVHSPLGAYGCDRSARRTCAT